MSKKYEVGDVYQANDARYGSYKIIAVEGCKAITIEFINTGTQITGASYNVTMGKVKDPMARTVAGVGYIGIGPHKPTNSPPYKRWRSMLDRCYVEDRTTYAYYGGRGVYVCDDWHNFQNYCEWWNRNCCDDSYQIDKDLLVKGNLEYGPYTCVAIPRRLNYLFADSPERRGTMPIGVHYHSEKLTNNYSASMQSFGKAKFLGFFDCPIKAHRSWQVSKVNHLKTEIDSYFDLPCFIEELRSPLEQRWKAIQDDYDNMRITEVV